MRSFLGPLSDRTALLTLLGLCLALKGMVLAREPILARDGIHYIRFANDLVPSNWRPPGEGGEAWRLVRSPLPAAQWPEVLKRHPYHPGYPSVIAALSCVVQSVQPEEALSPTEWQWCAHAASALAGVLLVLPVFGLARCFAGTGVAWVGAALFVMLPAVVQITTDTLAESWLLLFTLSGLWCLVRGMRTMRPGWFALAGVLAGCGYLFRLEALVIPASGLLALITYRWWTGSAPPWRAGLLGAAGVVAGFLWVAAPYMVMIGKISNRPSADQVVPLAAVFKAEGTPASAVCLAERRQDGVNGRHADGVRVVEALSLVLASHGKAGHYFVWPLAAVGVAGFWAARRRDPAIGLLGSVALVHLAMLFRLAYSAGYTSERHALLLVCLAAILGGVGLTQLITAWQQRWPGRMSLVLPVICVLLLVGLCVPKAIQPLHAGQEGHRQAGLWLSSRMNRGYDDTLVDPYLWTSYYAWKVTGGSPPAWGEAGDGRSSLHATPRLLGVVDPRDNDLNRNRDWEVSGVTGPGSVVLWSWPSAGQPKVVLRQAVRR